MRACGKGTLRVGIDNAPPAPLQIGAPEAGNYRGYEVSLIETVAERLGFTIRYRRALWSVIVAELSSGKLDLVCSAATVTPERAQEVDFCAPHLKLTLALVTREGARGNLDWTSSRIGVRRGTTAETYLKSKKSTEGPYMVSESNDELYAALATGQLDAVIDDSPIALHFSRLVPNLRYAGSLDGTECEYAVMVRRGNAELRSMINAALNQLEADGTLPGLRRIWFGSPDLKISNREPKTAN